MRHRKTKGAIMTFYILGGIVALGLMVYLVIALLKPELFS
jgi:K+-transporting ATPase KdpF subunit